MCARYYIGDDLGSEVSGETGLPVPAGAFISGDVHPGEMAAVIGKGQNTLQILRVRWGMHAPWNPASLVINARSETAGKKRMFSGAWNRGRCAVPASAFYEWDREKQKVDFHREDGHVLYLGGFIAPEEDGMHLVILTEEAGERLFGVHDRMPLIFRAEELGSWICGADPERLLGKERPRLRDHMEYRQQRLPFC